MEMGFGENIGMSSMMTMMPLPLMSNPNFTSNTCYLPLPPSSPFNNNHHQTGTTTTAGSSLILMNNNNTNNTGYFADNNNSSDSNRCSSTRDKVMAHPLYPRLLVAYLNCQKVGAPADVVARLEEAQEAMIQTSSGCIGEDPELDQFMEAYCEMLTKYEHELTKPFKEAMFFISRIESQFKALCVGSSDSAYGGDTTARNGSSDEDVDLCDNFVDPQAEERELKGQLFRKYSGYLGNLKQEFMKKKKKGKLPKEARSKLLDWWSKHYKWPYPSEPQKIELGETTGLDQKQINNWFINQRKRHWKASEDMQFVVMDTASGHPHYYLDNIHNPFSMDGTPSML
ncbi:hypothetical protein GIB67_026934 [Kingdonia uniflora]|uniref:Uncharacterized protein n=1 Tax=Kingdonia uniflora TaxID=39325 RepID=A0A7J7P1B8_9MAGN|nr:hypothetical protein GIB67_026934 [Kingdonia uniflora]